LDQVWATVPMAGGGPWIGGGGSDNHRAAGSRIMIADGGSEGLQMRSADDGYKISIGGGGGYS